MSSITCEKLPALANPDTPPFVIAGLKREHLLRSGSVVLHEWYFDNLGGNGQADAETRTALSKYFGYFDRWKNNCLAR